MLKNWQKQTYPLIVIMTLSPLTWGEDQIAKLSDKYTMSDLEILEREHNYNEFFQHARDIRPIERTPYWLTMLNNMAEGYTSEILKLQIIDDKAYSEVESLHDWPKLKENEFFTTNRTKIAIKYLTSCYQKDPIKKDLCSKKLIEFWQKNPEDSKSGIELLDLFLKYDNGKIDLLWSFIKPAVKGELSKFYCQKNQIREIITKKLLNITDELEKPKDLRFKLDEQISGACWESLRDHLRKEMTIASGELRKNLYLLLNSKDEISTDDQDLYHLVFLLDSPSRGELFNRSWNTITTLGENYPRREKVLDKIKKIDPLPGLLFSSYDKKKRDIIIKHLQNNVPEYLDLYAKTCLQYLEGVKNFANGNPTIHCKQLFQISKGTNLVDPGLQNRFKKIKFI